MPVRLSGDNGSSKAIDINTKAVNSNTNATNNTNELLQTHARITKCQKIHTIIIMFTAPISLVLGIVAIYQLFQ
jgi:hypothetical protein